MLDDFTRVGRGLASPVAKRRTKAMFAWVKPNGEIKDMTCRVALLRMQSDGLITLPPSQLLKPGSKPHFPPTPLSDPQASVQQPVHELGPLTLRPVGGTAPSRLWNESHRQVRQEIHQPQTTHPHQRYLAVPTAQELRQRALRIAGRLRVHRMFTAMLAPLARKPKIKRDAVVLNDMGMR